MTIYFDVDGTLNRFYEVNGWLECLENSNPYPYIVAETLQNMSLLARLIHKVQDNGIKVGVISWLSKTGTEDFNAEVTKVKEEWLRKHLPSVTWDEIHIVPYGVPKYSVAKDSGILFDDEERNRKAWSESGQGKAFDEKMIIETLKAILK